MMLNKPHQKSCDKEIILKISFFYENLYCNFTLELFFIEKYFRTD